MDIIMTIGFVGFLMCLIYIELYLGYEPTQRSKNKKHKT
jgi:hypothetical protein